MIPPLHTAELRRAWPTLAGLAALTLALLWSYWPTLATMAERWSGDPQYSHGFLVPVFAAVLLWHRREQCPATLARCWWGLTVLLAAIGIRLAGAYLYLPALDAFSFLPALAGLCLLVGGWAALRWAWPAIAFLGFMLPLPYAAEMALALPLRQLATVASTYALQTVGLPALAQGNVIHIENVKLGVVEACSGLGMLMTFFALSTAVAVILQRRLADRLVIVASAVPIAVIANVVRITATGIVHWNWGTGAGQFMHDGGGWLMMPLALGLVWLELRYLDWLLIEGEAPAPLRLDLQDNALAFPYPRQGGALVPCDPRGQAPASERPTPTASK
jgi:exosortase